MDEIYYIDLVSERERNISIVNHLPTIFTYMTQSTNKLAGITSGERDYIIHFQLALLTNITRIVDLILNGPSESK